MVPEEWTTMKLGEFCRVFSGGTPPRSNPAYYGGTIPWLKSGEVRNSCIEGTEETLTEAGLANSSTQWVEPNSTVIAMYGATAGAVGWLSIRATINQAIAAVIPNPDIADGRFIYHLLVSSSGVLLNFVQGSGQPNLNGGMIKGLSVLLPPLDEQRRIAAVLNTVDDAINAAQVVMEQASRLYDELRLCLPQQMPGTPRVLGELVLIAWGNTSITKASYVPNGAKAFSAAGNDGCVVNAEHRGPGIVLSAIGARCGKCCWADGDWTAIKNTITITNQKPGIETSAFAISQKNNQLSVRLS
jgi:hypothetical protein